MISIQVYGTIDEGHKLIIHNRKKLDAELMECRPCEVLITIKKKGLRSTPQNNYYHGIVVENVRHRLIELGNRLTHDECHEELKRMFLPESLHDADGVVIMQKGGSTATLNKSEFSDLVERIREWAAGALGIDIPDPDKSLSMNF
jgi:hypothetical protein